MTEPKPMQKTSDIGAMHDDTASGELQARLVQCQLPVLVQSRA